MIKIKHTALLIAVTLAFSCSNEEIIRKVDIQNLRDVQGRVVVRGSEDLLVSNDIVLLDSQLVVIDLKPASEHKTFFYVYDLSDFKKKYTFGKMGSGPKEFIFPMSTKTPNLSNKFNVVDVDLLRISDVSFTKDGADISSKKASQNLLHSFNLNQVNDSILFATKLDQFAKGLYYKYNSIKDTVEWVEYASKKEKAIGASIKYAPYYSAMCVNAVKGVVVVALRYFNKILFFSYQGELIQEIQVGKKELFPSWDKKSEAISSSSPIYCIDMAITNRHIYCLWVENIHDGARGEPSTKVLVFDWDYNYITSLKLDQPAARIKVAQNDSFILSIVNDGTGLSNIVKYDVGAILPNK